VGGFCNVGRTWGAMFAWVCFPLQLSYVGFQLIVCPSLMSTIDEHYGLWVLWKGKRKIMCVGVCGLVTQCDGSHLSGN